MPRTLSRRSLLVAAGGAAATVAAGHGAAPALALDEITENDLALLQLAASAELVSVEFYRRALATDWLDGAGRRRFQRARAADRVHYRALTRLIGPGAPTRSDFDLRFARRTFGSRARATATGSTIERATLGVHLTAAASADSPAVRALAARAAAAEARHVSALALLGGGDPVGPALPRALSIEAATTALSPFWG